MNLKQLLNPWVIVQAVIFMAILLLPDGNDFRLSAATSFVVTVLAFSGWLILIMAIYDLRKVLAIEPDPIEQGNMQTSGVYAHIRHPMYTAVWMIFLGIALGSQRWLGVAFYVVLVCFFIAKSRYEEQLLIKAYPGYKKYMHQVGAFVPKILNKPPSK